MKELWWALRMARRDARFLGPRFLLYAVALALGLTALVATDSLTSSLREELNLQAKSLLGADVMIESRYAPTPELEATVAALPGEKLREISFRSMAAFAGREDRRLVQVRALEEGFPFYGAFETEPPDAVAAMHASGGAIVDENVLMRFNAGVGDSLHLGHGTFKVVGVLKGIPGEALAFSLFSPRVLIPIDRVNSTGLLGFGSVVDYKTYLRLPDEISTADFTATHQSALEEQQFELRTVDQRRERLGDVFTNVESFFTLSGLIAVLLAALGIGTAMYFYLRQKLYPIAILRCLGGSTVGLILMFALQVAAIGLLGGLLGWLGGTYLQQAILAVVGRLFPLAVSSSPSLVALAQSVGVALTVSLLFSLPGLLLIGRVSPLAVLRRSSDLERQRAWSRREQILFGVVVLSGVWLLASVRTGRPGLALGYALGIGTIAAFFWGVGALATKAGRRIPPRSVSFVMRHGLSSLFRPGNQTAILLLALGIGALLTSTISLSKDILLNRTKFLQEENKPNYVLFDVQVDQREALHTALAELGLPLQQEAPVVLMRISNVGERTAKEQGESGETPRWALSREYWSTYRSEMIGNEELIEGRWIPTVEEGTSPVPISLEERIAERLNVGLGSRLVFNVQGVAVETTVASIRKVHWQQMRRNSFVVFPTGVLEDAPQFFVLMLRVPSTEAAKELELMLAERFPNVSAVDLRMIVDSIQNLLDKVSGALALLALFTLGTGSLVLIGALVGSRYQRIREAALLRTLGASRRTLRMILTVEYAALGVLAAAAALGAALVVGKLLALYVFKADYAVNFLPLLLISAVTVMLPVAVAYLSSREVSAHTPLETLRHEG